MLETNEAKLMTVDDLAEMLQMSKSWVYKAVAKGLLPFRNIGASVRFDRREIEAYINGDWTPQAAKVVAMKRGR